MPKQLNNLTSADQKQDLNASTRNTLPWFKSEADKSDQQPYSAAEISSPTVYPHTFAASNSIPAEPVNGIKDTITVLMFISKVMPSRHKIRSTLDRSPTHLQRNTRYFQISDQSLNPCSEHPKTQIANHPPVHSDTPPAVIRAPLWLVVRRRKSGQGKA